MSWRKHRRKIWPLILCASPRPRPWRRPVGSGGATRRPGTARRWMPCASVLPVCTSTAWWSSAKAKRTTRPCCTMAKVWAGATAPRWTWPWTRWKAPICWLTGGPTPFLWWAWPPGATCSIPAPAITCKSWWFRARPARSLTWMPRSVSIWSTWPRLWAKACRIWWSLCWTSRATSV